MLFLFWTCRGEDIAWGPEDGRWKHGSRCRRLWDSTTECRLRGPYPPRETGPVRANTTSSGMGGERGDQRKKSWRIQALTSYPTRKTKIPSSSRPHSWSALQVPPKAVEHESSAEDQVPEAEGKVYRSSQTTLFYFVDDIFDCEYLPLWSNLSSS